jgi:hypothetical protein
MSRITPTGLTLVGLALALGLIASDAFAAPKKPDNIMGVIWSYTLTKGDKKENGTFRVYKKEIFKGDKKVGHVDVKDEDETTLVFTDWSEMNGTATLRKTRKNPPTAGGTLRKKDGSEWEMKVQWKEG